MCERTCPRCGEPVHADHCHRTGKARRLLCNLCNRYVGVIERYEILDKLVAYCRAGGTVWGETTAGAGKKLIRSALSPETITGEV